MLGVYVAAAAVLEFKQQFKKSYCLGDVDKILRGRVSMMTEDRGKWINYVHGVANPRIEDG